METTLVATVADLQELEPYSIWGRMTLGSRLCGVTHDSPESGFPGKSRLAMGIRIVDDVEQLDLPMEEDDFDPVVEAMLEEFDLGKPQPAKRVQHDPVGTFLSRMQVPTFLQAWELIPRLERWYTTRGSLSRTHREHYQRCWSWLTERLDSRLPWAREMLDRLEAIELDPPYPSIMPVTGTVSHDTPRRYRDKPVLKSRKPKHHKRHSRQRKHARTKTHVHRPALG